MVNNGADSTLLVKEAFLNELLKGTRRTSSPSGALLGPWDFLLVISDFRFSFPAPTPPLGRVWGFISLFWHGPTEDKLYDFQLHLLRLVLVYDAGKLRQLLLDFIEILNHFGSDRIGFRRTNTTTIVS